LTFLLVFIELYFFTIFPFATFVSTLRIFFTFIASISICFYHDEVHSISQFFAYCHFSIQFSALIPPMKSQVSLLVLLGFLSFLAHIFNAINYKFSSYNLELSQTKKALSKSK
jgi:hypothetical protein